MSGSGSMQQMPKRNRQMFRLKQACKRCMWALRLIEIANLAKLTKIVTSCRVAVTGSLGPARLRLRFPVSTVTHKIPPVTSAFVKTSSETSSSQLAYHFVWGTSSMRGHLLVASF